MGKKKRSKKKAEQRKKKAELRKIMAEQRKAASLERRALAAERRRAAAEQRKADKERRKVAAEQQKTGTVQGKTAAAGAAAKKDPAARSPKRRFFPRSGKVQYPIGIKLVIIITFLLLVSLGTITALVSYMVSMDLRITAEDTNFTVNRRSAAEADHTLQSIRSNTLQLLESLSAASDAGEQLAAIYFERNQDVAAVVISSSPPLVNERFFLSNEIETALIDSFMIASASSLEQVRGGEPVILNAAPVFGTTLLALILPWEGPGGSRETITAIFSSDYITDSFGGSVNTSYMINQDGDILIHADQGLVLAGANNSSDPLVMMFFESRDQNFQTRYTDKTGVEYFGGFINFGVDARNCRKVDDGTPAHFFPDPKVMEVADVISTMVYRVGIRSGQFSFTAAIGLFQSVICVLFLVLANTIAQKAGERGVW